MQILFFSVPRLHKEKYMLQLCLVRLRVRRAGGGSGACICSHAAVMESKTDECAHKAIYSAWLQNKKPRSSLSFFQWPFYPIAEHMSSCSPSTPHPELGVNHLEIIKFNKAEQIK